MTFCALVITNLTLAQTSVYGSRSAAVQNQETKITAYITVNRSKTLANAITE